ncbi:YdeI/OmpD-associated family protein [Antrihabitans cavernicola]|uniref:Bacteriocin-protection protein, YdeI/OmpD-associated family n=1 Tax=Antrihabitans cavernicola TaxID=2495913 RepID=A0A5A7SBM3_9NOCA|nr:YdeI/OmpD-associated family protein [Spelaeibacter cavernicola]KAA0022719.1 hypothetical protein FOY51_13655 [Spelaeibacter cavernicola]
MAAADRSIEYFPDGAAFREWLEVNHGLEQGVWLKFAKKASGETSIDYAQALDQALCFGWIDGQTKGLDANFYLQGFTPRRARSPWSKRNVGKIAELAAQGLLHPAGQAQVDRAKADGRWDRAYDGPKDAKTPQDFLDELAKNPAAAEFFETLDSQNRFQVYYQLNDAIKPETRARRIAKFVQMFADGKKFQ